MTAATISWTTGEAATSQVQFGPTTDYGLSSPFDSGATESHSVSLGRLLSGTGYHFRVVSVDAAGNIAISGDGTFTTTSSGTVTVLTSSQNPSASGSSVTLTASVTPSTATGTLTFLDGATTIGTATLSHGSGSITTGSLAVGSHSLTVVYAGNGSYPTSTSNTVTQVVESAGLTASTTTLTSSVNPTTYGQATTLTATVSPDTATGTVTFKDGATTIGAATLGHGSGSLAISNLAVGSHSLTAVYGGDSNYAGSTSNTVTQTVNQATSTTVLASSVNPTMYGASTTLTASVSPSQATGTMTFKDGSTTIGTATLSHGSGTLAISALAVGSHSLTAVYGGDSNDAASTSNTVTQTVNQAATTTVLTSSSNPSAFGSSVTFTATVPTGATGTVTFKDGSTTLGASTLGHGSGTYVTSALSVGTHSITAVYGGDSNYLTSTSSTLSQVVSSSITASTTTLTSSVNPSIYAQSVTFTATISPDTATGTVTFMDGVTTIGTATLSHGSGTLAVSSLAVGSHSLTAVYGGDGNDAGSTSSALSQVVSPISTFSALVSSLNPALIGQSVILTATVTPSTATGTATVLDGIASLGTVTLGHGSGSLVTGSLAVGSHSLTAVYSGNPNYLTSTSAVLTQVVSKLTSATTLTSSLNPATVGESITLTATVSPSTATGTVTILDGQASIGAIILGNGSGTLTTSALSTGTHSLTAVYGGDSTYEGGTSAAVTQVVSGQAVAPVTPVSPSPAPRGGGGGGGGGTIDGTPTVTCTGVGAKRVCTSVLPTSASASASSSSSSVSVVVFSDVPTNSWYATAVSRLASANIISGYLDAQGHPLHLFKPANPVTVAEALKMLLATLPLPLVSGPPQNLSARNTWAASVIATTEQHGLTILTPQRDVHTPMSRGAVIESMVELAGLTATLAANRFSDLPASHPYTHAILVATQLGLVRGDDGKTTLRPDEPISRAEVAVLLTRLQGLNRSAFASVPSSPPVSASTPSSAAPALRFTTVPVHLRAETSGHAASLAQLPTGTPVTLLDVLTDWAKVRAPNGTTGYVLRQYLRK